MNTVYISVKDGVVNDIEYSGSSPVRIVIEDIDVMENGELDHLYIVDFSEGADTIPQDVKEAIEDVLADSPIG